MIKLFKPKKKDNTPSVVKSDWPSHVENLHIDSFDEFITKYPLTMIDFWAPWCEPCKTMIPRLRRLEKIYHGRIAIGKVNTQEERKLSHKYNVMSIPHFAFFRNGKKIGETRGLKSISDMKNIIESYLSKYDL